MSVAMNLKAQKQTNTLVGVYLHKTLRIELLQKFAYSLAMQETPVDVMYIYDDFEADELEAITEIISKPVVSVLVDDPEGQEGEKRNQTYEAGEYNWTIHQAKIENFSQMFNLTFQAAKENEYEFMSIAECEDEVALSWYKNAQLWASHKTKGGIFLPIIKNTIGENFTSYVNEFCWADNTAERAGYYDMMLLTRFNCIHPLGALYRMSHLLEEEGAIEERDGLLHPMKESLKLTSYYEFFLRMVYNDIEIVSVPRIGYQLRHTATDTFSYISSKIPSHLTQLQPEKGGMTQPEIQHWTQMAIDDYIFEDNDLERVQLN